MSYFYNMAEGENEVDHEGAKRDRPRNVPPQRKGQNDNAAKKPGGDKGRKGGQGEYKGPPSYPQSQQQQSGKKDDDRNKMDNAQKNYMDGGGGGADNPKMNPEVRVSKRFRGEGRMQRDGRMENRDRERDQRQRGDPNENMGGPMGHMGPMGGPMMNYQQTEPKKFTNRCRLFAGNLPPSITEEEFKKLFEEFGEVNDVFLNKEKRFGFVNLETRKCAEAAKAALNNTMKDGRTLRVNFANQDTAVKVKNIPGLVTNELLEAAFSNFGEVERAVVIVDHRGRPVGEGIVEFARKQSAYACLRRCAEECFFLTSALRPVSVEMHEPRDEEEGFPEKNIPPNNAQYMKEREIGPRLGQPGSFEHAFGLRWKQLYELEKQKRDNMEKEIVEARHQLEEQMEYALYEYETNCLREKLRHMEEQNTLFQREREMRQEEERRREEQRRQEEMLLHKQQDEILRRRNFEELRRREDMFMMQQDAVYRQMEGLGGSQEMGEHMGIAAAVAAMNQEMGQGDGAGIGNIQGGPQRQSRFDQSPSNYIGGGTSSPIPGNAEFPGSPSSNARGNGPNRGNNREIAERRSEHREDFPMKNKRRRY